MNLLLSRPESLLESLLQKSDENKSRVDSLKIDNLDSRVNLNYLIQ